MRLLLTLGCVLAAAVVLVVGYTTDNIALIYVSIAFSAASSIGVALGRKKGGRRAKPVVADRPAAPPVADRSPNDFIPPSSWTVVPAPVDRPPVSSVRLVAPGSKPPVSRPPASRAPVSRPAVSRPAVARPTAVRPEPEPDDFPFPIEDYDELGVAEILPLLTELDDYELARVLEHEESGAGRVSILNRIDALLAPD